MRNTSIRRRAVAPLVGIALACGLSACGSDSSSDGGDAGSGSDASTSVGATGADIDAELAADYKGTFTCLLYTSPSPRD